MIRQFRLLGQLISCALLVVFNQSCAPAKLAPKSETEAKVYKIRFVLAHRPYNEWILRSIHSYGDSLEKKSGGRIKMEIIPIESRNEDRFREGADRVYHNTMEMSQISLVALSYYSPSLQVMELPFIFRSHEHASAIMDGPIGRKLFDELLVKSKNNIRGLAYTYSGGLRGVITKDREIRKYEDFKGLTLKDPIYPVARDLFAHLKADIFKGEYKSGYGLLGNGFNAREVQCAYDLRVIQDNNTYVYNETNHSLFMTGIVINETFFQSLPKDLQELIKAEAQAMALEERDISVQEKEDAKKLLRSKGIKVISMAPDELLRFKEATQPVIEMYTPKFQSYVQAIQNTKAGGSSLATNFFQPSK